MAATVDIISGGRLEFGIGAGGSALPDPAYQEMVHREYDAFGIDVVAPAQAVGALGEACTMIKRLWSEQQPFDFDGRWYQIKGAVCEPKPAQRPGPPMMIGAGGERSALRVVAEHADIWNCPTNDVEEFRHKSAVLDQHCATIDRDPSEIIRSVQVLVSTRGSPPDGPAGGRRQMGPAEVRERLLELIHSGVSHLVLAPVTPDASAHWSADNIVEPVLAMARHTPTLT